MPSVSAPTASSAVAPRRPTLLADAAGAPASRRWWSTVAAFAGITTLAILSQIYFGAFGDISWMLTIGEAWFDGKTPYVDFIETNPPASLLLYMPAVAAGRWLEV